ncbi:hypothetical protein [Nostoc sp.]|uniref:hypothetical protein n=1 Tax=Nostoc sp. TaxID=1180 RepID=UPI002FFA438A
MSNPLHKNKVIQFLKKFPNSTDFTITTSTLPLTISEDPAFIPGCTVGLSGQAGNPANFNSLIDMWVAGGLTRANINPYGLMRLWAAAYRTYYDWIKKVQRPLPNPNNTSVLTSTRIITPAEYEIRYSSSTRSSIISNTSTTGSFIPSQVVRIQSPLSIKLQPRQSPNTPRLIAYPYISSGLFDDVGLEGVADVNAPAGALTFLYGGPIKCEIIFNKAVDVQQVLIPIPENVANPAYPESGEYQWFFPSNFKIRTGADGSSYNSSFEFNKIINALDASVNYSGINYDWRQIGTLASATTGSTITALNALSKYSSSSNLNIGSYSGSDSNPSDPSSPNQTTYGFPNDLPFNTSIKTITYKNSLYTLDSIVVGRALLGHQLEILSINKSGVPKTCILKTWFKTDSIPRKTSGTNTLLTPTAYEVNALDNLSKGYFEIYDVSSTPALVASGTCESPVNLLAVKNLELTSGINDGSTLRPYLAGFVNVQATVKDLSTPLNSAYLNNRYLPNFTDSYWISNSINAFDIGGVTFSDEIAKAAYSLLGITGTLTNVEKWRLLPFTLPISSTSLRQQIVSTPATLRTKPTSSQQYGDGSVNLGGSQVVNPGDPSVIIDYAEDYLNNKILRLPTLDEIDNYEYLSSINGIDPLVIHLRSQTNEFLISLINYCKSTCLKFWKRNVSNLNLRVRDYQTYTSLVLQYDNLTLSYDGATDGGIQTVMTYEILTGGTFDIERNIDPGNLYFLSGGGASKVEVDVAVLQKILSISGITI